MKQRYNVDDGVWYSVESVGSLKFEVEYAKRREGVTDEEFEHDGLGNCSFESEYFPTRQKAIAFAKKQYTARVLRVWLTEEDDRHHLRWEPDAEIWA